MTRASTELAKSAKQLLALLAARKPLGVYSTRAG